MLARFNSRPIVARREVYSGLALGTILGVIGFLRISVWSLFSDIYGPHWLLVALTVGLSLIGIVLWGMVSGSMLPFVLRRLGFDPGRLFSTLCCDPRRCNGPGDLLHRGQPHPPWHPALAQAIR